MLPFVVSGLPSSTHAASRAAIMSVRAQASSSVASSSGRRSYFPLMPFHNSPPALASVTGAFGLLITPSWGSNGWPSGGLKNG